MVTCLFKRDCVVIRGAEMIAGVVENDKILYEMAPESHVHSYKSGRTGETLDVDA
jgi:hypothetical protein